MMRPAFSSTKSAAAFALLLLVLLLLPVLAGRSLLPARAESYSSVSPIMGSYPYMHRQVFGETGRVDIAFIGSSRIYNDIDTPQIEKALSQKLGRQAEVITLGWFWPGFDPLYFITQDLLRHRQVSLIVFDDESAAGDNPHRLAPCWFRFGDNAQDLAGIPLRLQAAYYFGATIGLPRNLLCRLRPNFSELTPAGAATTVRMWRAPDPMTTRGSLSSKLGFNHPNPEHPGFVDYAPANGVRPEAVCVFSPATSNKFKFTGPATATLQLEFARKFAALAQAHQTKLVFLHMPETGEMRMPVIQERVCWPDILPAEVAMVGIPPAALFAGLSDEKVRKLFVNPLHLNHNGAEYFTSLIMPALFQLYDAQVKP